MGNSPNKISTSTRKKCDSWWRAASKDLNSAQGQLFDDCFISKLLGDEPFHLSQVMEGCLKPEEKTALLNVVKQGLVATEAGVREAQKRFLVERLTLELAIYARARLPPASALSMEKRLAVLSALGRAISRGAERGGEGNVSVMTPGGTDLAPLVEATQLDVGSGNGLEQLGLGLLLRCLLDLQPQTCPDIAPFLQQSFSKLAPLQLYHDWADFNHGPPEKEVELRTGSGPGCVEVFSSIVHDPHGPSRALQRNTQYFGSSKRQEQTDWCLKFPERVEISSIRLQWHKCALPKFLEVHISQNGQDFHKILTAPVKPQDGHESYLVLDQPKSCRYLKLFFFGFARCNLRMAHKLELARVFTRADPNQCTSPCEILRKLWDWVFRGASCSDIKIAGPCLGVLLDMVAVTGSPTCLIQLVVLLEKMQILEEEAPSLLPLPSLLGPGGVMEVNAAAQRLVEAMEHHLKELTKDSNLEGAAAPQPVRVVFEPAAPDQGHGLVCLSEDHSVTCPPGLPIDMTALLPARIASGKASWALSLGGTTSEGVCIGVIRKSRSGIVTARNTAWCQDSWYVECSSGRAECNGVPFSDAPMMNRPQPGDVVQFTVDVEAGEMHVQIAGQGPDKGGGALTFHGVGADVYPAISFKPRREGGDAEVRLVGGLVELSRSPWCDYLASLPEMDSAGCLALTKTGKATVTLTASRSQRQQRSGNENNRSGVVLSEEGEEHEQSVQPLLADTFFPHGIVMVPSERAKNGTVRYHLQGNYSLFESEVSIAEGAKDPAISTVFQVLCDGVVLWTSPSLRGIGVSARCQLPVLGVNELQLRVRAEVTPATSLQANSSGAERQETHGNEDPSVAANSSLPKAVWVAPCLHRLKPQNPLDCLFEKDRPKRAIVAKKSTPTARSSLPSLFCRGFRPSQLLSLSGEAGQSGAPGMELCMCGRPRELHVDTLVEDAEAPLEVQKQGLQEPLASINTNLAHRLLQLAGTIAAAFADDTSFEEYQVLVTPGAPFCIDTEPIYMDLLCTSLKQLVQGTDKLKSSTISACLKLVRANLKHLMTLKKLPTSTDTTENNDSAPNQTILELRGILEHLLHQEDIAESAFREELACTVQSGLSCLYPNHNDVAGLLQKLLLDESLSVVPLSKLPSASVRLLSLLLRRLASFHEDDMKLSTSSPGVGGLLKVLACQCGGAEESGKGRSLLSNLLLALKSWSEDLVISITEQQELVSAVRDIILMAHCGIFAFLCSEDAEERADHSTEKDPKTVISKAFVIDYTRQLLVCGTEVLAPVLKCTDQGLVSARLSLQRSPCHTILPAYVTALCLSSHRLWLSSAILPSLLNLIQTLDATNKKLTDVARVEKLLRWEQRITSRKDEGLDSISTPIPAAVLVKEGDFQTVAAQFHPLMHNNCIRISSDGKVASLPINESTSTDIGTVLLSIPNQVDLTTGVHRFSFNIGTRANRTRHPRLAIGVLDVTQESNDLNSLLTEGDVLVLDSYLPETIPCFLYGSAGSCITQDSPRPNSYGSPYNTGDTVVMELNLTASSGGISFSLNGTNLGVMAAWLSSPSEVKRFAPCVMLEPGDSVRLEQCSYSSSHVARPPQQVDIHAVTSDKLETAMALRFAPSMGTNLQPCNLRDEVSVIPGSDFHWGTVLFEPSIPTTSAKTTWGGTHEWIVEVMSLGQEAAICIGVVRADANRNGLLGVDGHGWGLLGDGRLWWAGAGQEKAIWYGNQLCPGDTVTVSLNLDLGTLSFGQNGRPLGPAFGPPGSGARVIAQSESGLLQGAWDPAHCERLFPAVSLYGHGDKVKVAARGLGLSTYQIPWIHQLLKLSCSLAGRMSTELVAGEPVSQHEIEFGPWMSAPFMTGGVIEDDMPEDLSWLTTAHEFLNNLLVVGEEGHGYLLFQWLEKHTASHGVFKMLKSFPDLEQLLFAVLLLHTGMWPAAQKLLGELQKQQVMEVPVDPSEHSVKHLLELWSTCNDLRRWLQIKKQAFAPSIGDAFKRLEEGHEEKKQNEQVIDINESKDEIKEEEFKESDLKQEAEVASSEKEEEIDFPDTFLGLMDGLKFRLQFLLELFPAVGSKKEIPHEIVEEKNDAQLSMSIVDSFLLPKSMSLHRSTSSIQQVAPGKSWNEVLSVLHAQHQWRKQHGRAPTAIKEEEEMEMASGLRPEGSRGITPQASSLSDTSGGSGQEISLNKALGTTLQRLMHSCFLYATEGELVTPQTLKKLSRRRSMRCKQRKAGLHALHDLVTSVTPASAIQDAITHLRAAFRGLAYASSPATVAAPGTTEEAPNSPRPQVTQTSTEMAEVASQYHHYDRALGGGFYLLRQQVRTEFYSLYTQLAVLLEHSLTSSKITTKFSSQKSSPMSKTLDAALAGQLLWCWVLDFEPCDYEFLHQSKIVKMLHQLVSLEEMVKEISASLENDWYVQNHLAIVNSKLEVGDKNSSSPFGEWMPWGIAFVTTGLKSGTLSKRRCIHHMRQAPSSRAPSLAWWEKKGLGNIAGPRSALSTAEIKISISDLIEVYEEFLQIVLEPKVKLEDEKSSCLIQCFHLHGKSALKFPVSISAPYITFEAWMRPLDLNQACHLVTFSNNEGSGPKVVLRGGKLEVQVFFCSYTFQCQIPPRQWTHLAISWAVPSSGEEGKLLRFFINGRSKEQLHLNARLDLNYSSVTVGGGDDQVPGFCGRVAHIRLWKGTRSSSEILNWYAKDLSSDEMKNDNLVGFWPLEGSVSEMKGTGVSCQTESCELVRSDSPFHALAAHWEGDTMLLPKAMDMAAVTRLVVQLQKLFRGQRARKRTALAVAKLRSGESWLMEAESRAFNAGSLHDRIQLAFSSWAILKLLAAQVAGGSVDRKLAEGALLEAGAVRAAKIKAAERLASGDRRAREEADAVEGGTNTYLEEAAKVVRRMNATVLMTNSAAATGHPPGEFQREIFSVHAQELKFAADLYLQNTGSQVSAKIGEDDDELPPSIPLRKTFSVPVGKIETDLNNNVSLQSVKLETLEVDNVLYSQTTFLLSISDSDVGLKHLQNFDVLQSILQLIMFGSPRLQFICLKILENMAASNQLQPVMLDSVLSMQICTEQKGLIEFLLTNIGNSALFSNLDQTLFYMLETKDRSLSVDNVSNYQGAGAGYAKFALADQCISVFLKLMDCDTWQPKIINIFLESLEKANELLDGLNEKRIRNLVLLFACVAVLGGALPMLRFGGKVEVEVKDGNLSRSASAAGAESSTNDGSVVGVVVDFDPFSDIVQVSFGSCGSATGAHHLQIKDISPLPMPSLPASFMGNDKSGNIVQQYLKLMKVVASKLVDIEGYEECKSETPQASRSDRIKPVLTSLWVLILRSFPYLVPGKVEHGVMVNDILPFLYKTSLCCVDLPTFVSSSSLENQSRALKERIYEAMLPDGGLTLCLHQEAVEEKTDAQLMEEAKRASREVNAIDLSMMVGYPVPICIKALELNDDQPDAAAEWLFSGKADAFSLGRGVDGGSTDAQSGEESIETQRWKQANELQFFTQMPPKLCYQALEMFNENREQAVNWLLEEGRKYMDRMAENEKHEIPIVTNLDANVIPLGLQSCCVSDTQMHSSSNYDEHHAAKYARLHSSIEAGAWCPGINDTNQFLEIDLGGLRVLKAIASQGRCPTSAFGPGSTQFVSSYKACASMDGMAWEPLIPHTPAASGADIFKGNSDSNSVVTNFLQSPVKTRYVRLLPVTWDRHIAFRVELYGSPIGESLTLQLGMLPVSHFEASSCAEGSSPEHGQLNSSQGIGAWVAGSMEGEQYLQVDLGYCASVTGIATQGRVDGEEQWVSSYQIFMSSDKAIWTVTEELVGNQNGSSVVLHNFMDSPLHGRFLRVVPRQYQKAIALRLEVFTAPLGSPLLTQLADPNFVCTSQLSIHFAPHFARLGQSGGRGGWCPSLAEASSPTKECYIEVDLGVTCNVNAIATQGQSPSSQLMQADEGQNWVAKYEVKTSTDGEKWSLLSKDGGFEGNCDCTSIVVHQAALPTLARFVRLRPLSWNNKPVLRFQIFGKSAGPPIGLQSESVSDEQLTASSQSSNGPPKCFRLFNHGAWRPSKEEPGEYLQVKLRAKSWLTGFAIQGGEASDSDLAGWVTSLQVSTSTDGAEWEDLKARDEDEHALEFPGTEDPSEVKTHILPQPKWARYIRFKPLSWCGALAMRAELYGMGIENRLGMEHGTIVDSQISSSSATFEGPALKARLNGLNGSWVASQNDSSQYLQIDLKSRKTLVGISIQGKPADSGQEAYITSFNIKHSVDGELWQTVQRDGVDVYFSGNKNGSDIITHLLPAPLATQFIRVCPKAWHSTIALRIELYGASRSTSIMEDDEAALEDTACTIPLLLSSSARSAANEALEISGADEAIEVTSTKVYEAYLAPFRTPAEDNPPKNSVKPVPGMLVTITQELGNVVSVNGRTGWLGQVSDNLQEAKVWFLDVSTGFLIAEKVMLKSLRAHVQLFGHSFKTVEEAKQYSLSVDSALAIHYARCALLSFLKDWKKVSDGNSSLQESLSLEAIGGATSLIDLVKLVAASEGSLQMHSSSRNRANSSQNEHNSMTVELRKILEYLLSKEIKGNDQQVPVSVVRGPLLSQVLVEECVSHFVKSTKPADSRNVQVRESLHPYVPGHCVEGEVTFKGATALRIHFDPRSRTQDNIHLEFSLDKAFSRGIQRCSGPSSAFRPFLIHSEKFFYRFNASREQAQPNAPEYWGYQFSVVPLIGLQWLCEGQVLTEASLEWACWVLDFLLAEAASSQALAVPVLPQGAVHNNTVFGALVRYLRSSGVPYKHHVISLLTCLLQFPALFSTRDPPNLGLLSGLVALVKERCAVAEANFGAVGQPGGSVAFPVRLQALMELAVAARLATQMPFSSPTTAHSLLHEPLYPAVEEENKELCNNEFAVARTHAVLQLPPNPDDLPMVEVLADVLETAISLTDGSDLPQEIICEAYLKGVGIRKVIDSEELLMSGKLENLLGEVKFDGATELQIRLIYEAPVDENTPEQERKAFCSDAELIIEALSQQDCVHLDKHGLEHGLDIYQRKAPSQHSVEGFEETKENTQMEETKDDLATNFQPSGGSEPLQFGTADPNAIHVSLPIDAKWATNESVASVSSTHPLCDLAEEAAGYRTPDAESDFHSSRAVNTTGAGELEISQMVEMGISREWALYALRKNAWNVDLSIAFTFENDMDDLIRQDLLQQQETVNRWRENQTRLGSSEMGVGTDMESMDEEALNTLDFQRPRMCYLDGVGEVVGTFTTEGIPVAQPLQHTMSMDTASSYEAVADFQGQVSMEYSIDEQLYEDARREQEQASDSVDAHAFNESSEQATGACTDELNIVTTTNDNEAEVRESSKQATGPCTDDSNVDAQLQTIEPDVAALVNDNDTEVRESSEQEAGPCTDELNVEAQLQPAEPDAATLVNDNDTEGSTCPETAHPREASLEIAQIPDPESNETSNSEETQRAACAEMSESQVQMNVENEVFAGESAEPQVETANSLGGQAPGNPTGSPSEQCLSMMAMGLERQMCERALQIANNDVQMALEMCFDGTISLDDDEPVSEFRQPEAVSQPTPTVPEAVPQSASEPTVVHEQTKGDEPEKKEPSAEDLELKAAKENWQKANSDISSELVLDHGLCVTLLVHGLGFLSERMGDGEHLTSLGSDFDNTCLLELVACSDEKHDGRFLLKNWDTNNYLVALSNGNLLFRQKSTATAFLFELQSNHLKLALRTPEGRYVRAIEGGFRADIIPASDFNASTSSHWFDVIARTYTNQNAQEAQPAVFDRKITLQSPGRPLGMESGLITNDQITASSESNQYGPCEPFQGRLDSTQARLGASNTPGRRAWFSNTNDINQFLQVDLKETTLLTGIATQGYRNDDDSQCFVKEFRLSVSMDGETWAIVQERGVTLFFPANISAKQIVKHRLKTPIACRYVRIMPTKYHAPLALRAELYGVHRYKLTGGMPLSAYYLSHPIIIPGDCLQYAFKPPTQGTAEAGWPKGSGFKFVVTAVGMGNKEKEAWLKNNLSSFEEAKQHMKQWTPQVDEELSVWVTHRVEQDNASGQTDNLLALAPHDVVLSPREQLQLQLMASRPALALHVRFSLLQQFNRRLRRVLPCIDLKTSTSWKIGSRLRNAVHCIFYDFKLSLLEEALQKTASAGHSINLNLDHQKKMLSHDKEEKDPSNCQCLFVQAFQQLHDINVEHLRLTEPGGRVFRVRFEGEAGIDAGGVYRDAVSEMVEDLHSPDFNLLILCANGQHKINLNMDKYIPSPKSSSPLAIQMLEFLGKLMGISLRTKATLPFNFPAFVWKGILGQTLSLFDLEGVDSLAVQYLRALQGEEDKMTKEEFEATYGGVVNFTTTGSTGETVDLIAGGSGIAVTYYNRLEYCLKVEHYRLHELDQQMAAIRRGLGCIVPLSILQLFTWQQVEVLIAGQHDIDVEYLKEHTEYKGFPANSDVIKFFWSAMETFSSNERSQFIRFVWGRSRLPNRGRPWPQLFKIQLKPGANDGTLPVTHTCFFSIEMPAYSSEEIMKKRLLTAINFGVGGILNG